MMALFAYGTLMCEDIMRTVAGTLPRQRQALLRGYRRLRVKGKDYPALVPDPEGSVAGVLYSNLTAPAWGRLDRFEGAFYARTLVSVERVDGKVLPAAAYVARSRFRYRLAPFDWDFAEFLRNGKKGFQRRVKGHCATGNR